MILKRSLSSNVSGLQNQTHLFCILLMQRCSSSPLSSLTGWCSIATTRTYFSCLGDSGLAHRSPSPGTAGASYGTLSLTDHRSNYYPEPRGLNSSALISQLRFMTEEKEASAAREVLCDPSGRRWVPNKQGQPYYHVCIYLHEDELFSSSSHTVCG